MADVQYAEEKPMDALFDQLDDIRNGMLSIKGSDQHPQPMTHFLDRETGVVWFITSRQTDLVAAIGQGATAQYTAVSPDQDFHISLQGPIIQTMDQKKLEELWGVMVSAWFEGDETDPDVILLKMTLGEAAIWSSTDNIAKLGYQLIKAHLNPEHTPDVGTHKIVDFRKAM
ncbi:pyridoxamine 5'-phosphate oxidase family protein [Parasulfitobacter algicola]|uniref:Pyridoxamine 5'-phosphate oxidase family protein n=1 Tax=Parasulfitobacter algicola TaxID=2614809 RepID=A0ABX2IM95_9RHOB|nr:pyridoxamine 5'-phosphate oxidase family protein [Sulfitobacter algicola]NSX53997.1 pyridoxamine 5'-phosphate oxidase family protein [Sulfitobacter algicola]